MNKLGYLRKHNGIQFLEENKTKIVQLSRSQTSRILYVNVSGVLRHCFYVGQYRAHAELQNNSKRFTNKQFRYEQ